MKRPSAAMQMVVNCCQRTQLAPTVLAAVRKALRMRKPVWSSFNAALRVWTAFSAILKRSGRLRGVILHDPASDRPKNLDNPFHDAGAQERVGDLIARSTRSAERKPPK